MARTSVTLTATETAVRDDRLLRAAATFFAIAVLVHNADHLRRGSDAVDGDVFWIGSTAMIIEVAVVAIIFMRHHLAPLAAVSVGFSLAVGYLFVHFTPERSWLSDSFLEGDAAIVSILAAALEATSAVVLGLAGLAVLRRRGGLAGATEPIGPTDPPSLPVRVAAAHPVVAAMALGNAAIFVLSFA